MAKWTRQPPTEPGWYWAIPAQFIERANDREFIRKYQRVVCVGADKSGFLGLAAYTPVTDWAELQGLAWGPRVEWPA